MSAAKAGSFDLPDTDIPWHVRQRLASKSIWLFHSYSIIYNSSFRIPYVRSMFDALMQGLATGFVLSWTFGTVFFALIQTSLDHGYRKGMHIAMGVAFSDLLFVLIAVLGTAYIPAISDYNHQIGTVGGCILIGLGISMFFKKHKTANLPRSKFGHFLFFFTTGFLLNVLNPMNFFSWIFVSTTIYPTPNHTALEVLIFYSAVIATIFGCEVFIAVSAARLKKIFNENVLHYVDIVSGIVFIGIGAYLIYDHLPSLVTGN